MVERELQICNKRGLHARAAARFVHLAASFQSQILVVHDGEEADGKSILSLMVLGASMGSAVTIRAEGPDEDRALETLAAFITARCEEDD